MELAHPSHRPQLETSSQGPWAIISGKRRREAYRRLGRTHIEAIPVDVPLQEAMFMAIAANRDDKPFWLGEYKRVENLTKRYGKLTQVEIKARTGWSKSRVSRAVNLTQLLNQASRELIGQPRPKKVSLGNFLDDETGQDSAKPAVWRLTEKVATRLIPLLDDKNPGLSQYRAEEAVRIIIERQLTGTQTDNLVAYTLAGNDPAQFEPAAKVRKTRSKPTPAPHSPLPPEMANQVVELPVSTHHIHPAHLPPSGDTPSNAAPAPPAQVSDEKPGWFWQWMLGIKFISQLRSKVKKGENLTTPEKILAGAYRLYGWVLEPVGKRFGKFCKWAGKGIWDSLKKAFGKVFGKIVEVVLPWVIVALLVWGILAFFHFVVVSPWHWIEHKIGSVFHHEDITPAQPTPVIPQPVTSTILPKVEAAVGHLAPEKKVEKPTPTMAYQPSVSFSTTVSPLHSSGTLYDPKILESEIKSLPIDCVVKDYPMTPDEGMPGDVAVSRMQDITDPDKYTLMIGSGKEIVSSVNPTNTTLTIYYKSADPFGNFLDSNGKINFLWENVLYIHTNEIDIETKNPSVIYQCSLVVSGSQNPLTLQCATAADLEHLVSTMQYFIRSSRLAHDTALTGMPYPSQGLRLNNDCLVETLWAGSPMDKAGVTLGGMVWSADKNGYYPPKRNDLQTQLTALPAGPHNLYLVSPADRNKARIEMNTNHANVINPKRRKVLLTI